MTIGDPPSDRLLLTEPRRQSPIAVFFLALKVLRGIGLVNLGIAALFIFRAPVPGGLFLVAPLIVIAIGALGVLSWWRFTFNIVGDELRVTKGIFSVQRLTVPLDRVQSVAIDQEFLHRAVGVVRASVDTAGSAVAEFTIDAVDRPVAEALQRVTAEHVRLTPDVAGLTPEPGSPVPPPPPIPEQILVRHDPLRLVKVGLAQSPWAGLAVFAPLLAVGDDLSSVFGIDVPDPLGEDPELGMWIVWFAAALAVGATLISLMLQVVREVTSNWDLTLTRTPTGLRRTAGLFSKSARASSISKIQRIEYSQTPIQRWFGFRNLSLPTIGAGHLSIPGATDDQIERVRNLVIDDDARVDDLSLRISPLAVFLVARNGLLAALVMIGATWTVISVWSLAFLMLPIAGTLATRRRTRLYRWGISSHGLAERATFITVTNREMVLRKTQVVSVSQSFFERRRDLATVRVSSAAGHVEVGMIPLADAKAVRDRAVFVAETDRRQWM